MKMALFAFGTADWSTAEPTEHTDEIGMTIWHTRYFDNESDRIRVRTMEYAPDYLADYWCKKGCILFCLDGELETTLGDGRTFTLMPGMNYQVGNDAGAHQSTIKKGARLLIAD